MMANRLFQVRAMDLSVLLFLFSFGTLANAQGLCPIKTVTVASVQGQVFGGGAKVAPIPGTLVELRTISDENRPVESIKTDEEGRFSFQMQESGSYRVVVHLQIEGKDVIPSYEFVARIKRERFPGKELRIVLEVDCANTEVRLVRKSQD